MKDRTEEFCDAVEKALQEVLQDTARRVAAEAQSRAPSNSGELARSIMFTRVWKDGDTLNVAVVARAKHAASIEFGSAGRGQPNRSGSPRAPPRNRKSPAHSNPPHPWPNNTPPGKRAWEPYDNRYYADPKIKARYGWTGHKKHPGVFAQPFMRPAITKVVLEGNVTPDLMRTVQRHLSQFQSMPRSEAVSGSPSVAAGV